MKISYDALLNQIYVHNPAGQVIARVRRCENREGRGWVIQSIAGSNFFSPNGQWYAEMNYTSFNNKKPPSWPDPMKALEAFLSFLNTPSFRVPG